MQYIIIINLIISAIVFIGTSVVFYDKGRKAERHEWQAQQSVFLASIAKAKAENDARIDKQRKKHEKILLTVMSSHNEKTEKLNADIDKLRRDGLRFKSSSSSNCGKGTGKAESTSVLAAKNEYRLSEETTRRLLDVGREAEMLQELRNNLIDVCSQYVEAYDDDIN